MVGYVTVLGNPKKRKKRRRKMSALQRKYFGKRTGSTKKRKRRARAETVIVATSNPRRSHVKKRHRRHRRRTIKARTNPRRRRFIRARRNPRILSGGMGGFFSNSLMPAAVGAAGAIGVDMAIGNLTFIPATWKTGTMLSVTRVGLSLGVGALVGMIAGDEYGEQAAAGGIVVALYALAKNFISTKLPSVKMARYVPMNRYLGRRRRRLGFIRRQRLAAMPPVMRARALMASRMRGSVIPGLGNGPRRRMRLRGNPSTAMTSRMRVARQGNLGYMGPAHTMGRYMNTGR
jgi:hypothetical protein